MSGLSNLTSNEKDELMEKFKQEMVVVNMQELLTKMTEKCFNKCIGKPGARLDFSEEKCISMCMDRFMDSWNLISRAYGNRLQREQNNM